MEGVGAAAGSSSAEGSSIAGAHPSYPFENCEAVDPVKRKHVTAVPFGQLVSATASVRNSQMVEEIHKQRDRLLGASDRRLTGVAVIVPVPFELWARLLEWITVVDWTRPATQCTTRIGGVCSWAELAVAFSTHGGFVFSPWDLADASALVAAAFRRINARVKTLGIRKFGIDSKCNSIYAITGHRLGGISCRPILGKEVWYNVVAQLRAAADLPHELDSFGRGYSIKPCRALCEFNGRGDDLAFTNFAVAACANALNGGAPRITASRPKRGCTRVGPCALGCASDMVGGNQLQSWHGVPKRLTLEVRSELEAEDDRWGEVQSQATLCTKCYRHALDRIKVHERGGSHGSSQHKVTS